MGPLGRMGARIADPERMRVYPFLLALAPLAVWLWSVLSGAGIVDREGNLIGPDFSAFYMAGAFAGDGRTGDLSSFGAQTTFQRALALPVPTRGFTPWISPPFVAFAFAPLARLPYLVALGVFSAASAGLLVVTLAALRRRFSVPASTARLVLLALSFFPTLACFLFGQTSVFSLALLASGTVLLLSGRDLAAGCVFGCFAYKPQLAVGVVLMLLFARRWRALAGGALAGVAWIGVSMALAPRATLEWASHSPQLLALIRDSEYRSQGLASLYGATALLLDGVSRPLASSVAWALTASAAVALLRLWTRVPWRTDHPSFRLALASTLAAGLLLSPHLYFYDLTLLIVPFALTYAASKALSARDEVIATTAWVYVLGFVSPYLTMGEQALTSSFLGRTAAVQLETIALAVWCWRVGRAALAAL